ncbi:Sodium-dependent phosphate transporter [hydrothermal vent metagenome]|uniref:Sodium-dependent phosphate transporter n=1 Tax=hydrothermal vent metagenome TaxID=652676 RepID=A0A3B1CYN7_9ZZZZ
MNSKMVFDMVFHLIGGLGIFLFGMKSMSDGLQAIAGGTLRRLIALVTNNRVMAVIAGIGVTCLVQSSSITTVMAVGFVNSGFMMLNQAMGVILGANIGTTVTGWILVLKIGKYGLPILGIGIFFYLFSKNEKIKYIALAVLGIGMIFFGLELMKNGFKPLRGMEEFRNWFLAFNSDTYLGVLKTAAVGCLLTVIVQSSSATLGITIGLAQTGLIGFETAAALVLGENIGTTITAYLSSIGASTNAKRAAYFHVFFNVIGVLIITALFSFYLPVVRWIMTLSGVSDISLMVMKDGIETYPYITSGIATVHTVFNVANTLIFFPFLPAIATFLNRIVKEKIPQKKRLLTNLDFQMYESSFAAVEQSRFEIEKLSLQTQSMFETLEIFLEGGKNRRKAADEIFERENMIDEVQKEITEFLTHAKGHNLGHDLNMECTRYLLLADEFESISDYIMAIVKLYLRLEEHELEFTTDQKQALEKIHKRVKAFYAHSSEVNQIKDLKDFYQKTMIIRDGIINEIKTFRREHWEFLSKKPGDPLLGTTFTDLLVSYRKINSHIGHMVETYVDE